MLDQAHMHRQGHVYHAEPCTRRRQWPLGAEQACKEILPLELHMVRQAVVIRDHALHLAAVSNVHATRSSTRRERAVIVVSASSCSLAHSIRLPLTTGRSPAALRVYRLLHVQVGSYTRSYTCLCIHTCNNANTVVSPSAEAAPHTLWTTKLHTTDNKLRS